MRFGILFFLFSALLLSSCLDDPQTVHINNVAEQFEISLSQVGSSQGMILSLDIESVDDYLCSEAQIITTSSISSDQINVDILKIEVPDGCEDQSSSVKTSIPFDTKGASYSCNINVNDLSENNGVLNVDEHFYSIEFESNEGLVILNKTIRKIPNGYFWGTIAYDPVLNPQLNDESVIAHLHELMDDTDELIADDYGIFTISENRTVRLKNNPDQLAFISQHVGVETTKSLLLEWESHIPSLDIQASFDDGSQYLK